MSEQNQSDRAFLYALLHQFSDWCDDENQAPPIDFICDQREAIAHHLGLDLKANTDHKIAQLERAAKG